MTQILSIISTNEITMLKDIDNVITINKNGKFKYFHIPSADKLGFINFISKLENEAVYTVIPLISMLAKDNEPHIILSKQILVANNSSAKIIHDYFTLKLDQAILDFGITNLENANYYYLILKYKKVHFDFSKLA
jgi:hypothetical protein